MGKSFTNPNGARRWDMPHSSIDDYKRAKAKKELEELAKEEEEEGQELKPFWEELPGEEQDEEDNKDVG